MSVLDKYFGIFSEGSGDSSFRQRAIDVYRRLLEALKHIGESDLRTPKAGQNVVSVNIGDALDDSSLKDLEMWFVAKQHKSGPRTGAMFKVTTGGKKRIEMYVYADEQLLSNITPDKWKKIMKKLAAKKFEELKQSFWHEFVHYMDMERMSPSSRKKAFKVGRHDVDGERDTKKYYNDPVEFNAYVQQGLSKVEDYLTNKPANVIKRVAGASANEFYDRVVKLLPAEFFKNMEEKYKNKLKKRVAKMWEDLMGRAAGGNVNV